MYTFQLFFFFLLVELGSILLWFNVCFSILADLIFHTLNQKPPKELSIELLTL